MMAARTVLLAGALVLGGCASSSSSRFDAERTVFNNPYVPPVIDPGAIGPRCDEPRRQGSICTSGGIIYPGRGRHALLANGEVIRLTRAERRFLRDRADALEAQRDISESLASGKPLPPGSPALPQGRNTSPPPAPPPTPPARERDAP